MKTPDALSEFVPAYVAEVEELLASARAHLLAAEAASRRGSTNPRATRDLFRALHTIKGLSAMVDAEGIVRIAHLMETALRAADRAGGRLPGPSIEPLLRGVAAIEKQVQALARSKPIPAAPSEVLEALEGLIAQGPSADPARRGPDLSQLDPALLQKLTLSEREQLGQGVEGGARAVRLDFAPTPVLSAAGLNVNTVRQRVGKVAEIVKVVPMSVPAAPAAPGGLVFALLVLTRESDAALAEAAGLPPSTVQLIAAPSSPVEATESPELDEALSGGTELHGLIRVDPARLDEAMERVGALVVNRFRLTRASQALAAQGVATRELSQVLAETARLLRDLRGTIVRLRMVRVAELFDPLLLLVRGLRRSTGKQVALELDLGAAELDKSVGDRLFPAIVHLVRNAVDHAIESPAERERLGKPPEGLVRVQCRPRSSAWLELSVSDDGRGVDPRRLAERAGAAVPSSDRELLELLCRPGLSTRDEVSTTSGRGMGMDIVKRIVADQLGGEVCLHTGEGRGTTFTLRVPLTVSIIDAFIFEAGDQRYAVAVSAVEDLMEIDPAAVTHGPGAMTTGGKPRVAMLNRRGAALPLIELAAVFARPAERPGRKAIVVQLRGEPLAFAVDRLVTQQEIVVRPMEDALVRVRGVSGATDLGDGQPTLVLDLAAVGASWSEHARRAE